MSRPFRFRLAFAALCLTISTTLYAQGSAACNDTTTTAEERADACLALAKKRPRDRQALREAGHALRTAERYEEAIEQYRGAIDLQSRDGDAHHGLGHALTMLDRDDEALRSFRTARTLQPDTLELWYDILWLLSYLERVDTVAIEVSALRQATPDSASRLKAAGDIVYEAQLYAEAVPFFERALVLDSMTWVHHTDLAYTLARLERSDDALTVLHRGIRLLPRDTSARAEFAGFLAGLGNATAALVHLDTLADLTPYSPDPLLYKGQILSEIGELERAIESFEAAVTRDPTRGDSHFGLAHAFMSAERYDDAFEEFAIAIRLDSLNAGYHNDMGVALERAGRLDTARIAYGRAFALEKTELIYFSNYVLATARSGYPDSANAIMRAWVAQDSADAGRELVQAQLLLQFPDAEGAIASATRALAMDSTLLQAHALVALGYMMQEKGDAADSALVRGLAQDSTAARLWALRALLHSAQEQHARAMEYWNRAFELDPTLREDQSLKPAYEASREATAGASSDEDVR